MPVKQVTPYTMWPGGNFWAIAVLTLEPAQLADRYGLIFETGEDDGLGDYARAAIELADGTQALLMGHTHSPWPGTPVYVDVNANFTAARELVLKALDLTPQDYNWVSPESEAPADYPWRFPKPAAE